MKKRYSSGPIHYGYKLLFAAVAVGGAVPLVQWLMMGYASPVFLMFGGGLLMVAGITIGMELRANEAKPGDRLAEEIRFDPERQTAVIRCSICTGEKVAGFRDKESGRFREVMVIRSPGDEQRFKETYHLDSVKTEY